MQKLFSIVAALEGLSLLGLLFVGVPLKYMGGDPSIVKLLGMPHGVLFIAYVGLSIMLAGEESWSKVQLGAALVLSSVPFGTWIFDYKIRPKPGTQHRQVESQQD